MASYNHANQLQSPRPCVRTGESQPHHNESTGGSMAAKEAARKSVSNLRSIASELRHGGISVKRSEFEHAPEPKK
jgi:hypothetical protein